MSVGQMLTFQRSLAWMMPSCTCSCSRSLKASLLARSLRKRSSFSFAAASRSCLSRILHVRLSQDRVLQSCEHQACALPSLC